jgi:hypothetical protein
MGARTTCDAGAPRWFARCRFRVLLFAAGLACTGAARAQALLEIDQAVWTDAIDRDNRNYTRAYKSPVALKKISLWILVRGSPELLERMKQDAEGRVRIRHVWKKLLSESVRLDHDQVLEIGRREDLKRLGYEVAQQGYFRWRTWSDKVQLTPGDWKVDIVWDTDEPVLCTPAGGEAAPCSYSLEVR